jgi:GT2 family glycosyltransferase
MDQVAVVILNYNGIHWLEKFLPGVLENTPDAHIIVADNASTDQSVEFLQKHFPDVTLLRLKKNEGYSQGYNEALTMVDAKYYVLLNSDIEVTPGWLSPLIRLMESDNDIAACQPKILSYHQKEYFEYAGAAGGYIDSFGFPFCKGRVFTTLEKDHGQYNDIYPIFWATGACLVIRSEIFHSLGRFDPDFFAHMEEIDLCWRIEAHGDKVMYNGHSTVYHVGGGTLHKSNPRKTYLNFRNGLTLLFKNYSAVELWTKFPVRLILDLTAAIKFILFDSVDDGGAVLRAHLHFWADYRINLKKRKSAQKTTRIKNLETMFNGSIVWQYFVLGKKKFTDLPIGKGKRG